MQMLLSIDFDFWVQTPVQFNPRFSERGGEADHKEWMHRFIEAAEGDVDLRNEIDVAPSEWPTVDRFPSWLSDRRVSLNPRGFAVMDQHHFAFNHFCDVKEAWLINIDAHHDAGYHGNLIQPLDCGNWISHLVRTGTVKKLTIIYPIWRQPKRFGGFRDSSSEIRSLLGGTEVEVFFGLPNLPESSHFERSVLARSGASTPPWLDTKFNELATSLTGRLRSTYEDTQVRLIDYVECKRVGKDLLPKFRQGQKYFNELMGSTSHRHSLSCE